MHEYAEYSRSGVMVCYTCDPMSDNNAHRPAVAAWERGERLWINCDGENVPSPA